MKIKGQKLEAPARELVVIPRSRPQADIVLWAQAVLDVSDFDKLCPVPLPPTVIVKGGEKKIKLDDPAYLSKIANRNKQYLAFLFIRSFDLPENELEWETVDRGDPKTWLNYRQELLDAKFSNTEINRLEAGVLNANCLNEVRIKEARDAFLRGVEDKEKVESDTHHSEP